MYESYAAADIYLESNVLTASPERLRLMLITAALQQTNKTAEFWRSGDRDAGLPSLTLAQAMVSELHSSIRTEESELAERVASIYLVLYRQLMEAQLEFDLQRIEAVIGVLSYERETWQLVCEAQQENSSSGELPQDSGPPGAPYFETDLGLDGLSIEA